MAAFDWAAQVYDGKVTATEARKVLADDHGLNHGSAGDLIAIFRRMMQAEAFKRSLSESALTYFLDQIKARRGIEAAGRAATSAQKHVEYYESHFNTKRPGFRRIITAFRAEFPSSTSQTLEDLESTLRKDIESALKDSHAARLERLKKASKTPETKLVEVRWLTRNPDVVAEVLYRADGFCEQCKSPAPFLKKSNGQPHLEVHHVVPLADGGQDTIENSKALCPNCHRRAHYG